MSEGQRERATSSCRPGPAGTGDNPRSEGFAFLSAEGAVLCVITGRGGSENMVREGRSAALRGGYRDLKACVGSPDQGAAGLCRAWGPRVGLSPDLHAHPRGRPRKIDVCLPGSPVGLV